MDQTADPCKTNRNLKFYSYFILKHLSGDDFYKFSCGSYEKKQRLEDETSSTSTFDNLQTKLLQIIPGLFYFFCLRIK
jgi:hypothetical protein